MLSFLWVWSWNFLRDVSKGVAELQLRAIGPDLSWRTAKPNLASLPRYVPYALTFNAGSEGSYRPSRRLCLWIRPFQLSRENMCP